MYKKVFKKKHGYTVLFPNSTPCYPPYVVIDTVPNFLLRSADKKMYVKFNTAAEELLYDFDLDIGDTLPATYVNVPHSIYVVSVDSIQTQNGSYKIFGLGGETMATHLIEGVGSTEGLIEPLTFTLDYMPELTCYSQNDTAYYPAVQPGNCDLHVGLEEEDISGSISVSPNPFTLDTRIEVPESWKNSRFFVHDAYGRQLRAISDFEGTSLTLHREELPAGIYMLRLTNGKQTVYKKVIVSD
jgi:hypothetical protein